MNKNKKLLGAIGCVAVTLGAVVLLSQCGSDSSGVSYQQIERLARPAINEGLVRTNAFLNAYNSIPPTDDLGASSVLAEVTDTLDKVDAASGGEQITATTVANGFVPDVMRIDTSVTVAVGTAAYNGGTSGCACTLAGSTSPILCCGRKVEDDVMDVTLSYLITGDPTGANVKDLVAYAGTKTSGSATPTCSEVGENPSVPGHQCLFGQTARNGTADFPYLAKPH